jgi:vacuolar protein sorting-associated protein 35
MWYKMEDDQDKHLSAATSVVKSTANMMQRAIEARDLREVLKHAANMLGELRTSLLSPKNYYTLYMAVFDEMRYLEAFFAEEHRSGRKIANLYEKVQYAGNIIPRLYLLITVGSVYIQSKELPAKSILKDLIEMAKGVQMPIRGLFLRYYLNKCCKDKLPDLGNEYEGEGGDVVDAIDFLVNNLGEMNRLWIRLQHTGAVRDKTRRDQERNDLRVTVGENLVRLANLQGVNIDNYSALVLPKVLEVIKSSKDVMSQQYLMDCIIQAFPDDFHLRTLEPLLEACTQLQPTVDIKAIFVNLMDRLSNYAGEAEDLEIIRDKDIFSMFKSNIDKMLEEQGASIETKHLLELQVAFLRFCLKCYPHHTEYVNSILDSCVRFIESKQESTLDGESLKNVVKLLSYPLETLSLAVLSMSHYPKLMGYLHYIARKQVAYKVVQAVVRSHKLLQTAEIVTRLFEFIKPLLKSNPDAVTTDDFEFEEEQQTLAKLVHLVKADSPDEQLRILLALKTAFAEGGDKRIIHTFPSLIFGFVKLLRGELPENFPEVLKVLFDLISRVRTLNPELALRLYLEVTTVLQFADHDRSLEERAYEFAAEALIIYEEEISVSEAKQTALQLITGTLASLTYFGEENHDTLISNTAQYSARLLKKQDQCIAITASSHMFWSDQGQNERRVVECLKKALKIADLCMSNPQNMWLFVLILNKYLYFIDQGVSAIEPSSVSKLIDLIKEQIQRAEADGSNTVNTRTYLKNTLSFIRVRLGEGRLQGVQVPV